MSQFTVQEIAARLKGEVVGDGTLVIKGVSGIEEAEKGDISFLANDRYRNLLKVTKASCVITSKDVSAASATIIRTDNPSYAFAQAVALFLPEESFYPKGISARSSVAKTAHIGEGVAIGDYVVVEENARIGAHSVLYAGCFVGKNSVLGTHCVIYPHVMIRENITIGNNVIIHANSVVGSDGFGFATINGIHHKIPQIGTVMIEDDVEVGACVAIDRARFGTTLIGKGTKIDNLVQIAHNVEIGNNCLIVAQSGISGSTVLGNNVVLAGQSGIAGHISIGDNAIVAAQAGVTKPVPANICVSGYPAKEHRKAKRLNACLQKLPELIKEFQEFKQALQEMRHHADTNAKNVKKVNKS